MDAGPESVSALLHTSRLFLLNQLVSNELFSQTDLERRASLLGLKLQTNVPCRCCAVSVLTEEVEVRRQLLEQAAGFLT